MLLKNAAVFDDDFNLIRADVAVAGDTIAAVGPDLPPQAETLDLTGLTLAPGFIDIHIHGCAGFDTCDAAREALAGMAGHLVRQGVTAFCPTTMTLPREELARVLGVIRACMDDPPAGAAILGANMEGPYISPHRVGAQRADAVRPPDWEEFESLYDGCGGAVKLLDLAPETAPDDFIRRAAGLCAVSAAHTEVSYEQAVSAFDAGVTHVTHLFNAMNGLSHRAPGLVGAALDDGRVMAEIICDGFHIHPAALRIAFRALGEDRSIIISDSMRAAGLPDGAYDLGGQQVFVREGKALLADGVIAGSTTCLHQELKNLVRFGVPLRQAIKSASLNPARAVGEDARRGSIAPGKYADLVALDDKLELRLVAARGKILLRA